MKEAYLILENGIKLKGYIFGADKSVSGEVVFNTGMVGYPETLTDPSYYGQILVFTYPLIGNYGVPELNIYDILPKNFESSKIQVAGLVVSEYSQEFNHWSAIKNLDKWLKVNNVPGLYGVDTRFLTKIIRTEGTMLGKLITGEAKFEFYNPNIDHLVNKVTTKVVKKYGNGKKQILLIDCGCKKSIITELISRKFKVLHVPYNYDIEKENFDGIVISNGPGNPIVYKEIIEKIRKLMKKGFPILGICLGHQLLALASGGLTYKLKFGHRSQNQPVKNLLSGKCFITSQNHNYAVEFNSLKKDWEEWFININDHSNEGILHKKYPFMSVQFHPEASPGPNDTKFIFDEFLSKV